jgi:tRNA(adenine34) deaminase
MNQDDEKWMRVALEEARNAGERGEVPIGACVVSAEGELIGRGGNSVILDSDPTSHAEIAALRMAGRHEGNYRLSGATVYSTIEPCAMCAGALVNARVARIVYGARDERFGAVETHFRICDSASLNHRMNISAGVLDSECGEVVSTFFRAKREAKRRDQTLNDNLEERT